MATDRLLEYINKVQQARMGNFGGFENSLHNTPLHKAMIHVDHAYEEAVHGAAKTDDPMTNSMLYQARILQDKFLERLGRDLTVHSNINPFWYSGADVNMYEGPAQYRRPWVHMDNVANGRSRGVWGDAQQWDENVYDFIRKGLWPRYTQAFALCK